MDLQVYRDALFPGEKKTFEEESYLPKLYTAMASKAILQGKVAGLERHDKEDHLVIHLGDVKGLVPRSETGAGDDSLTWYIGRPVLFRVMKVDRQSMVALLSIREAEEVVAEPTWKDMEKLAPLLDEYRSLLRKRYKPDDGVSRSELEDRIRVLESELAGMGWIREGLVEQVLPNLAIVNVGGIHARLPRAEMGLGYGETADRLLSVGDKIDVRVHRVDLAEKVVIVSLRGVRPDPWVYASRRYEWSGMYLGTVVQYTETGAWVELEPGVRCLARVPLFKSLPVGSRVIVRLTVVSPKRRFLRGEILRTA